MPWYPIIATWNEEASKLIVRALTEKGYKADYQTSKIEKTVFIRDEKEVAEELIKVLSSLRKNYPELFVIVVTEKYPYVTITSYTKFLDLIPNRDELYYRIYGVEVERPKISAKFFEDVLSRISDLEMRIREMRIQDLIGEVILLRREVSRMREEIGKLKEEDIAKFKEEIMRRLEELEKKLS
jgi:hypothetical protein